MSRRVHGLGIANEVDRPQDDMIVLRMNKRLYYIGRECEIPEQEGRFTAIEDFGVEVTVSANNYIVKQRTHSVAKYQDGSIRQWQEPKPGRVIKLSETGKEAINRWLASQS